MARQDGLVWVLFVLICFGLGYATLNRYDPRLVGGTGDTNYYSKMVTDGPTSVPNHVGYRVLVPFLARPFDRLANGRMGSWNAIFFGLLVANSVFTATTAFLLVVVGRTWTSGPAALLAGVLYLVNFDSVQAKLAGLVDSGEGCFLMVLVWLLYTGRFRWLPVCGVLGALAKETFVPFSTVLAAVWWLVSWRRGKMGTGPLIWIAGMALGGLLAITILHSTLAGRMAGPWQFAASLNSRSNYAMNFLKSLADRNLIYEYCWLLPLGLIRLRRMPPAWVWGSAAAVVTAFVLCAYYNAQPGTVGRATHSIAGPLLSLSVAVLLTEGRRSAPDQADRAQQA
jgi:hypothetical protein